MENTLVILLSHAILVQFMRLAYLVGYGSDIERSPVNRYLFYYNCSLVILAHWRSSHSEKELLIHIVAFLQSVSFMNCCHLTKTSVQIRTGML